MVLKRYQDAKAGYQLAKSFNAEKYLKKVGLGKEDYYFWKQIGKALAQGRERELAHLYERRDFPYPGDEEAMEEFVAKGGMIGTTIGPKGFVETDKDAFNYQKSCRRSSWSRKLRSCG
ncbi:hypothetical protein C1H46_013481 [Malus baccata]|uniref:Uncharacterized protein n=1 Tax=Malus baccata TaxID=106549 RepID=A0A540MQ80_MALBA|nr:hypothetical protein C1H46_013481 [Malus baccata]